MKMIAALALGAVVAVTGASAEAKDWKKIRIATEGAYAPWNATDSNNKLTGLPNELGKLTQLRTLDLRGNSYSKQDLDLIRKTLVNTNILVDGTTLATPVAVTGRVLLGPTCPVQRIPPDPNCADKPYQAFVRALASNSPDNAPFATTETDKNGAYKLMLPSGDYVLSAVSGKVFPRCTAVNITVKPDLASEIDLYCDTGIR